MKLITKQTKDQFVLKAAFKKDAKAFVIKKDGTITEDVSKGEAYLYVEKMNKESMKGFAKTIMATKRDYAIDVKSFISKELPESNIIWVLVEAFEFAQGKIYNVKTKKEKHAKKELINVSAAGKKTLKTAKIIEEARTYTRDLQVFPPNVLNSVTYADRVKKDMMKYKNIKLTVLNKTAIKKEKMGLLLSVNLGSAYEPRVVIMEYNGNPSSKDKTVIVGKGITFDAGGYNIKVGRGMAGMKYDMSGSASVVGTMMAMAQLKPKANFTGLIVLTDNMINSVASTPDAVFTAMNGKTVEINNTDAEGRLAMADGLTYGAKKLKATRLFDIATLTGAAIAALGATYTPVWTTTDKLWDKISKSAEKADELVWRMPFHKDYFKFMSGSKVADMYNTDLSGRAGSSSAAMFLSKFTEGVEYAHFDIAGTADVNGVPFGPMIRTFLEVANG